MEETFERVPDSAPIVHAVRAELPGARVGLANMAAPNATRLWVIHEGKSAVVTVPVVALKTVKECERLVPLIKYTLDRATG